MIGAIALVAGMMFIPNVYAYDGSAQGEVADATSSDTIVTKATMTPVAKDAKTKVLTYNSGAFKYVGEDLSNSAGKREGNYAWVGVKVSYPSDVHQYDYNVYVNGKLHNDGLSIKEGIRGVDGYTEWFGISEENLLNAIKNNKKITYELSFDWDKSGEPKDQIVIIEIDPMTTTLYSNYTGDPNSSTAVWTPTRAQEEKAKIEASQNPQQPAQSEETKSNEKNPDTSDLNIYALFTIMFISGCGVVYTFKKRFN